MGHELSEDGIEPSKAKVEAIHRFRAPINREELRSFLGLVSYLSKFVPGMATLNYPLRQLNHDSIEFKWTSKHQESFDKIKDSMSDIGALGYYDPADHTRLVTDASKVGLGAVLVQIRNNAERVIAYASKSLTITEQCYSTTEKEALAIVWGVERFSVYLLGIHFELETDHKALQTLFSKNSKPPARIERWVLRLQAYQFTVVYRKGNQNIADPFSRLPVESNDGPLDPECELYIRAIKESAAVDIGEIELVSESDEQMILLRDAIRQNNWLNPNLNTYVAFRDEYTISGNVILRGTKLVVPTKLRSRLLELSHEGHPGENLMKSRLRDRCWWPKIDYDVKEFIKRCEGCQLVAAPNRPEPMTRKELPCHPWEDVAIDFMGPMPDGEFILVIVDYYSRYMEIKIMTKGITANETIKNLQEIFTRLGYPQRITMDNGKQFVSREFEAYCNLKGVQISNTTPYWPQANGEVERQNRTLLKRLRISHAIHGSWREELQQFLEMYYTTPHSVTGKTPTELMFGRTIRSKLPNSKDLENIPIPSDFRDKDKNLTFQSKQREDAKRGACISNLKPNDIVLMKNLHPKNKLSTPFTAERFRVVAKKGSNVSIESENSGKFYDRNSSHLQKIPESPSNVNLPYRLNNNEEEDTDYEEHENEGTSKFLNDAATDDQQYSARPQRIRKPVIKLNL